MGVSAVGLVRMELGADFVSQAKILREGAHVLTGLTGTKTRHDFVVLEVLRTRKGQDQPQPLQPLKVAVPPVQHSLYEKSGRSYVCHPREYSVGRSRRSRRGSDVGLPNLFFVEPTKPLVRVAGVLDELASGSPFNVAEVLDELKCGSPFNRLTV